jgi:3,4-dihydroxy 2-butanone 4-phosphate synthase/GTP cyclohydrolase II
MRDYGVGAQILSDLGLSSIRLMTNNPLKIAGLENHGIEVTGQVPIERAACEHNRDYLQAKARRLGHTIGHAHLELVAEG